MPKVSEVAKELGYKASELVLFVELLNFGVKIEHARADVDARTAMIIKKKVPPRSALKGTEKDLYETKVLPAQAEEEAKKKAEKADKVEKADKKVPVEKKTKKELDGPVVIPAHPVTEKKEIVPAAGSAVVAVHAGKTPKVEKREEKKKEVVLVSTRESEHKPKVMAPSATKVGLTAADKAAIKGEVAKPLIDVDKVIGEEHQIVAQRAAELQALEKGQMKVEADKTHRQPPTRPPQAPLRSRGQIRPNLQQRRVPTPAPGPRPVAGAPPVPAKAKPVVVPVADRKLEIIVPISLKDFSAQTGIRTNQIQSKMMAQGLMVPITAILTKDQVETLALEFNRDITIKKATAAEEKAVAAAGVKDDPKDLVTRAPVVVFMGHVDHGKTTLMDRIRGTNVAAGEAGGITQHIGAYRIQTKDNKPVVFLDTPGHEAFTQMRARGANTTDVAVIVVDAADGVMPQTVEAINHAKAANVKIMVALNKIDKTGANPNKVKGELSGHGLQPEDWGGKTVCCEVSGLTGAGVDHLVEMLGLEAELLDLKANPKRPATGVVIEARKTDDRGSVATVLVQNGTLKKGDVILAGKAYGRVRALHDEHGKSLLEAGPSWPAEIQGFVDVPDAGDKFMVVPDIDTARRVTEERQQRAQAAALAHKQHITLEGLFEKMKSGELKEIRVITKVDVKGSLEVFLQSLQDLSHEEVKLKVLHSEVGAVNESDVLLADASDAIIVGFNVEIETKAKQVAKDKGVEIKLYSIIYQAIEEMKLALEGLLAPELVEVKMGHAMVKEVFRISRAGTIAGSMVTDGKIERSNEVRIIRGGKVIHTGKLEGLKRFKDDVKEVAEGFECGIKVANRDDIQAGDVVEAFAVQKVARKLAKK
jgi:translation initiation factor IF-2